MTFNFFNSPKTAKITPAQKIFVIKNLFWWKSSDIKSQTYTTGRNAPEMHVYTWYNWLHQKLCQTCYSWRFAISLKYSVCQPKRENQHILMRKFLSFLADVVVWFIYVVWTRLEMNQFNTNNQSWALHFCSTFCLAVAVKMYDRDIQLSIHSVK